MVWTWRIRLPRPDRIGRGATQALGQLGQALRGSHGAGGGHAQLDCSRIRRVALVAITSRLPTGTPSTGWLPVVVQQGKHVELAQLIATFQKIQFHYESQAHDFRAERLCKFGRGLGSSTGG